MSYDLTNGNVNLNYTFNVSPMWGHCFPTGINALDGLTGEQAVPLMRHMRKRMEEDREYLLSIEPENGWGDYQGAYDVLTAVLMASLDQPMAQWRVLK